MSDGAMGVGLLLFPQMYQQMMMRDGEEKKIMAVCPHCGALNEHPYKYCRECGKRPEDLRNAPVSEIIFKICPYCGVPLELPKQPRFCPYCAESFR
jgi:predicted amidophosphoribosyltransferase